MLNSGKTCTFIRAAALGALLVAGRVGAADGPPAFKRPPAKVATAHGENGILAPQGEFPGSVYFKAVSAVATEVRGKVLEVLFEVGEHVKKGQVLVRLDDELIRKDLGAAQARRDRDRVLLKSAETRLTRAEGLVSGGLSPTEQLDDTRFAVQGLRYSVSATEAELARLEAVIRKSSIFAPFDGIVIERPLEIGEWRTEGSTVAVIAKENLYEAIVELPEMSVPFVTPGMSVEIAVGARTVTGTVTTVVPRGDIATRTFPVKLRIESDAPLLEGMTARARMPIGAQVECLLLPRDAIINQVGSNYVFTAQDGLARKHPVQVVGYDGMTVGVLAPDLGPGQLFIVKGHERLIEGDAIEVLPASVAGEPVSALPAS
jgi:RND family efflux transporter MFP subunit